MCQQIVKVPNMIFHENSYGVSRAVQCRNHTTRLIVVLRSGFANTRNYKRAVVRE